MVDHLVVDSRVDWLDVREILRLTGLSPEQLAKHVREGEIVLGKLGNGAPLVDRNSFVNAVRRLSAKEAGDALSDTFKVLDQPRDELSQSQAAALCDCSPRTIRKAIRNEQLAAERRGTGPKAPYKIERSTLLAWRERLRLSTGAVYEALQEKFLPNLTALPLSKRKPTRSRPHAR